MYTQYRYKIEIKYPMDNGNEITIDNTNIHSLGIDYDYESKNMPIILLKIAVDKNLADDMVKNNKSKYMTLKITKFILDSSQTIYEDYINDQFVYFLDDDDLNDQHELDYNATTKYDKDIYKIMTIGLMNQDIINNNKKLINGIHNNTKLINILLYYLSHMKILIEPIVNDDILDNVTIPTLDTVTKFVKYMDSTYSIYGKPYRLFYDFDKSYLLSNSGDVVPSKDERYSTVVFDVNNTTDHLSKIQGMYIDNSAKSYIINVDTKNINMLPSPASTKSYTNIIGIDSDGNSKEVNIDLNGNDNGNTKIIKVNNLSKLDNIKNTVETNNIMVNINKNDLDTSIFTINKEYFIKNYNKLQGNNGKFILFGKREIYSRDSDNFVLSLVLSFKKINS